jgi:toxin ParE1/3/4
MALAVRISTLAQRDINAALAWTLSEFGPRQHDAYRELLHRAILEVAAHPQRARPRPDLHPDARTFHIARPGRHARHFLLLRVAPDGVVEIARLLHDAMDPARHLPPELDTASPDAQ